jgi:hypothetical protein
MWPVDSLSASSISSPSFFFFLTFFSFSLSLSPGLLRSFIFSCSMDHSLFLITHPGPDFSVSVLLLYVSAFSFFVFLYHCVSLCLCVSLPHSPLSTLFPLFIYLSTPTLPPLSFFRLFLLIFLFIVFLYLFIFLSVSNSRLFLFMGLFSFLFSPFSLTTIPIWYPSSESLLYISKHMLYSLCVIFFLFPSFSLSLSWKHTLLYFPNFSPSLSLIYLAYIRPL